MAWLFFLMAERNDVCTTSPSAIAGVSPWTGSTLPYCAEYGTHVCKALRSSPWAQVAQYSSSNGRYMLTLLRWAALASEFANWLPGSLRSGGRDCACSGYWAFHIPWCLKASLWWTQWAHDYGCSYVKLAQPGLGKWLSAYGACVQCEDAAETPRTLTNAGWVWQPACNSSLRRQRQWVPKTSWVCKLGVWLTDMASVSKVEEWLWVTSYPNF